LFCTTILADTQARITTPFFVHLEVEDPFDICQFYSMLNFENLHESPKNLQRNLQDKGVNNCIIIPGNAKAPFAATSPAHECLIPSFTGQTRII
jgi:hypothetical protein